MNLAPVLERYTSLCAIPHVPGVLVLTSIRAKKELTIEEAVKSREIFSTYDFARREDHIRYWDSLIEGMRALLDSHEDIGDDFVPGITLHYGFGAFGAVYCDVEPIFTQDTSYLPIELMADWSMANEFYFSPERRWSKIFAEAAAYISEKADSAFFIEPYPCPSPLDVVNLLRGNLLFTDFYEYPEELHDFLQKTVGYITELTRFLRKGNISKYGGAFCFGKYIPKGILLLEDAADLCSPETYRQFGKPYTDAVIAHFGGAYLHHHSLGRQQYENMSRLEGLCVQQISSDPGCPRPMTYLDKIMAAVQNRTILELECTAEEIFTYAPLLKGGRFILNVACKEREEAREITAFVRKLQP